MFALVDCNNFFASCERLFRPDLGRKPVAVLSNNDGCIIARSNEVKALGIPMGAPHFKVKSVLEANDVQIFSANFALYGNVSWRVTEVLKQFSPHLEVYSVDESFMGLDDLAIADYEQWGEQLAERVERWTGIPVSVGIGPSKTLAKAATELAKMNRKPTESFAGLTAQQRRNKLAGLPLEDVWGVGRRTGPKLRARGIRTAADLADQPLRWAKQMLTIRGQQMIMELNGTSCWQLHEDVESQKQMARTRHFGHNVRAYHELESAIANFTASVAAKLRRERQLASALQVFIQSSRFAEAEQLVSGGMTISLPYPMADTGQMIHFALQALEQIYDKDFAYKRAGVNAIGLVPMTAAQQPLLDRLTPDQLQTRDRLDATLDRINAKTGPGTLRYAAEGARKKMDWASLKQRSSGYDLKNPYRLPIVRAQ